MYMPLHPSFSEISSIQGLGAFVESRHTHILRNTLDLNKLDSKMRNNIRSAAKKLKITTYMDNKNLLKNLEASGIMVEA